jgi:hypothetical protein
MLCVMRVCLVPSLHPGHSVVDSDSDSSVVLTAASMLEMTNLLRRFVSFTISTLVVVLIGWALS